MKKLNLKLGHKLANIGCDVNEAKSAILMTLKWFLAFVKNGDTTLNPLCIEYEVGKLPSKVMDYSLIL